MNWEGRRAEVDKMIASEFIVFDYVSTCPYKWGIDISTLSQTEKNIIINCYHIMDSRNYVEAEKYALHLLEINSKSAPYNFLCALCFTANSFWHYVQKNGQSVDMFHRLLPHDITYYRSNAQYYYNKCIEMEPNNLIYLLQYAAFSSSGSKSKQAESMIYFEKAISLFKHETYQLNLKQYDINLIEYTFQRENIKYFLHRYRYYNNNQHHMVSNKLNELYSRYQRLLHLNESKLVAYNITHAYVAGYSRIGEYIKGYHILEQYHYKYTYLPSDARHIYSEHICIYLEIGQYEKAKEHVINISKCLDKFERIEKNKNMKLMIIKNQMLFYGYSCLIHSYEYNNTNKEIKNLSKIINKTYKKCEQLIKKYRHYVCDKETHLNNSLKHHIYFMKICFVKLCVETKCMHQMCEFLLESIIGSRFVPMLLGEEKCDKDNIGLAIRNAYYSAYTFGIIANETYERNADVLDENVLYYYYFKICLSFARKCQFENHSGVILNPYVPLSYYYIGLNALNDKLYQVAFKFLKKAYTITRDLTLIRNNCKKLIKKSKVKWVKQRCFYCKSQYIDINGAMLRCKCCKGCGSAFYCNKKCQKLHWKTTHKYQCKKYWEAHIDLYKESL
eukprot:74560_1